MSEVLFGLTGVFAPSPRGVLAFTDRFTSRTRVGVRVTSRLGRLIGVGWTASEICPRGLAAHISHVAHDAYALAFRVRRPIASRGRTWSDVRLTSPLCW